MVIAILFLLGQSNCVSDKDMGIAERIEQLYKDKKRVLPLRNTEISNLVVYWNNYLEI